MNNIELLSFILTIVSLLVGVVSIVLALFAMRSAKRTEERIKNYFNKISNSINGKNVDEDAEVNYEEANGKRKNK